MMMKNKLWGILFLLTLLLLPGLVNTTLVQAGDPDFTVGPGDPTHLVCADKTSHGVVDLPSDAIDIDGHNPDAVVDIEKLKKECEEVDDFFRAYNIPYDMAVEYARQSRIEGYVFEFHPDPNGPGGWTAVRSRDVPVVASGPGFELMWGSEDDGQYFFNNLGAGPVTLNLRLPPNAHPINPNITVWTTSFPDDLWEVDLAFYRGNIPPEDIDFLQLPLDHKRAKLIPGETMMEFDENDEISIIPNVGGVLPPNTSISTIALAAVILVILPTVGILRLRRRRTEE
jgi:hypothetical protein